MNNFYEYLRAKFFSAMFYCLKPTNDLRLRILQDTYKRQEVWQWHERIYMWLFELVWGFFEKWEMLLSWRNVKRMRKDLEETRRLVRKIDKKWVLHMMEEDV